MWKVNKQLQVNKAV